MAKKTGKSSPDGGRKPSRRVGVATIALGTLALAAIGTVLWLALSADTTMSRLRADADITSLQAEIALPHRATDEPAQPESVQLEPAQAEPVPMVPEHQPEPQLQPTPQSRTAEADAVPPAPIAELTQLSALGPLPRISADGRTPWQTYARPFDTSDTRPRIAIVITDMGHTPDPTNAAIRRLPGPITLAFSPYVRDLETWLAAAREDGHETLMMLPMEPETYPRDDPGPHTLLTSVGPAVNRERLEWVLSRGAGYVGVVTEMGSRFTASEEALTPVLGTLGERGLMVLDNGAAALSRVDDLAGQFGLPQVASNRLIDAETDRDAIDLRLQELEDLARENGFAVGIARPIPLTFERLAAWIPTLARKGIVLAPITAVTDRTTAG